MIVVRIVRLNIDIRNARTKGNERRRQTSDVGSYASDTVAHGLVIVLQRGMGSSDVQKIDLRH